MRRPLPLVACGMAAGVALAAHFGIWTLLCAAAACLYVGWRSRQLQPRLIFLCTVFFSAAWLLVSSPIWPGVFAAVDSLMVVQQAESGSTSNSLTVSLRSLAGKPIPFWNRVRGRIYCECDLAFAPGDLVRGVVEWQRPDEPSNPGEFDYASYLQRQGIQATAYLRERSLQQVSAKSVSGIGSLRLAMRERAQTLPGAAGELLSTLILGSSPGDWAVSWRQAGLAHVLAVSGLHVGLLLAMVLRLLTPLPVSPRWRYLMGAVLMIGYGSLVGPRPSVWRAIIMALIGLLALATGRLRDWQSALGAAAILLLLYNPRYLFDAGWQLSFAAAWGVLALAPLFTRHLPLLPWRLDRVIAASLAAQAATLPIVLYHFYLFTPLGIVSNLLLLPFLPLLLILGVAYLVFQPVIGFFTPIIVWAFGATQSVVDWLARVPLMSISPGQPPLWLVGLVLLSLLLVWCAQAAKWRRWLALSWLVLTLLGLSWHPLTRFIQNSYQLRVLAVGQGQSCVLHLPDNRALLFDVGGGRGSVGENIIVPYLRHQGTWRVSAIFLSHLDSDHVRGLADVLAAFPVDRIYLAASAVHQSWYDQLEELATRFNVPLFTLLAGDELAEQALRISVLHPNDPLPSDEANEDSLVLELLWPNLRVLLPGDIGSVTETEVLPFVRPPLDVLLVAHHGSANSSGEQFLSSLAPRLSIISTGPNQYGHPSMAALIRLGRYSGQVLRTDRAGAVLVWTNLQRYGTSQFRPIEP